MARAWEPGYEPQGPVRTLVLRSLSHRFTETSRLGTDLFHPWQTLRTLNGLFMLADGAPCPSRPEVTLPVVPCVAAGFSLARSLLLILAAFEAAGIRLGPLRPENLQRVDGCLVLHDPYVDDLLLPYRPGWPIHEHLNFQPPEVMRGAEAWSAGDRFSLGVMLYWLFCGCLPFNDSDPRRIAGRVLNQEPVDPRYYLPSLPGRSALAILALLAKEPLERPEPAVILPDFSGAVTAPRDEQRRWCQARQRIPVPADPEKTRRRMVLPCAVPAALALLLIAVLFARHPWQRLPAPALAGLEELAGRFYAARNDGDFAAANGLALPEIGALVAPPPVNQAIWLIPKGYTIKAGPGPDQAGVQVDLEEIRFALGKATRKKVREVISLRARRGQWRISALSRPASSRLGQSPE